MVNESDKINISLSDMTDEDKNELISLIKKYSDGGRKTKRYIPLYGEPFWYISIGFKVYKSTYRESEIDKNIVKSRNAFPDYESAAIEAERRKIICELKDFADEHNTTDIDWNKHEQDRYCIYCSYELNDLGIVYMNFDRQVRMIGSDVYFTSEEVATSAIKHIGKNRILKYVFGIEDE